jgi:hypothetical protein
MSDLVEIDGGILTAERLQSRTGPNAGPCASAEHVGSPRFFVSVLTADDGRRWCLWDGSSYDQAIVFSERIRSKFGISAPVVDLVAGGAS